MDANPSRLDLGLQPWGHVEPDLADLCRIHGLSIELIECSEDLDALLDRLLDEYESRLEALPVEALDPRSGPTTLEGAKKLRALVMFAAQAAALKARAEAAAVLRRKQAQLEAAWRTAEQARRQLDAVLGAVDHGVLVLDRAGRVLQANPAAARLTGVCPEDLPGWDASAWLGSVGRGQDGEYRHRRPGGGERLWWVSRRDLQEGEAAEVVVFADVTNRHEAIERRHRLERLHAILQTLGVLSHKINNPLTAVLGRAQLLEARLQGDEEAVRAVRAIAEGARRIAELVREMVRVVREGRGETVEAWLRAERPPWSGVGDP